MPNNSDVIEQPVKRKRGRPKNKIIWPDWFDLDNYERTKTLDSAGWYYELTRRYWLYTQVSRPDDLEKLRKNPIAWGKTESITEMELLKDDLLAFVEGIDRCGLPVQALSVRLLSTRNLVGALARNRELELSEIVRLWKNERNPEALDVGFHGGANDVPFDFWGAGVDPIVSIDLRQSDPALLEHFKILVDSLRQEEVRRRKACESSPCNDVGKGKKGQKTHHQLASKLKFFASWAVLPYIDLTKWYLENAIKIPSDYVFANAIFFKTDRENTLEKMSDYTKPWADRVMRRDTLLSLRAEIAREFIVGKD